MAVPAGSVLPPRIGMRGEKDDLWFSLERSLLYLVNGRRAANMINRTEGLWYTAFSYFKGDVCSHFSFSSSSFHFGTTDAVGNTTQHM